MRNNQSAMKVNTIRPGKLASLLAKSEAKSVEIGMGGTHKTRQRVAARVCRVVGGGMGVEVMSD